jgi:hypothetical protein
MHTRLSDPKTFILDVLKIMFKMLFVKTGKSTHCSEESGVINKFLTSLLVRNLKAPAQG